MMVPKLVRREHLHQAHAALNESSSDKATAAMLLRRRIIQAIEAPGFGGFRGQIERLFRRELHPRRKLVAGDPRFEVRLAGMLRQMLAVQHIQIVEESLLRFAFHRKGRIEIQDARFLWPNHRALKEGRQPAALPMIGAAYGQIRWIRQRYERRQILGDRPQAIEQPRPKHRMTADHATIGEGIDRLAMIVDARVHRAYDHYVIDDST